MGKHAVAAIAYYGGAGGVLMANATTVTVLSTIRMTRRILRSHPEKDGPIGTNLANRDFGAAVEYTIQNAVSASILSSTTNRKLP